MPSSKGWGWPPCSKILNTWYSRNERGLWWAIWNTSHNLGGALIPLLAGAITLYWGLALRYDRAGIIACVVGFALCFLLRDRPASMGLPTVGDGVTTCEKSTKAKALAYQAGKY